MKTVAKYQKCMGNVEDSCSVDRHYSQIEEGLYYVLNLDGSVLFFTRVTRDKHLFTNLFHTTEPPTRQKTHLTLYTLHANDAYAKLTSAVP